MSDFSFDTDLEFTVMTSLEQIAVLAAHWIQTPVRVCLDAPVFYRQLIIGRIIALYACTTTL